VIDAKGTPSPSCAIEAVEVPDIVLQPDRKGCHAPLATAHLTHMTIGEDEVAMVTACLRANLEHHGVVLGGQLSEHATQCGLIEARRRERPCDRRASRVVGWYPKTIERGGDGEHLSAREAKPFAVHAFGEGK